MAGSKTDAEHKLCRNLSHMCDSYFIGLKRVIDVNLCVLWKMEWSAALLVLEREKV